MADRRMVGGMELKFLFGALMIGLSCCVEGERGVEEGVVLYLESGWSY